MNRRKCIIAECKSEEGGTKKISFHQFPGNLNLRKLWLKSCKVEETVKITTKTLVCSKHFVKTDYRAFTKHKNVLTKTAIPTIFAGSDVPVSRSIEKGSILKKSQPEQLVEKRYSAKNQTPNLLTKLVENCSEGNTRNSKNKHQQEREEKKEEGERKEEDEKKRDEEKKEQEGEEKEDAEKKEEEEDEMKGDEEKKEEEGEEKEDAELKEEEDEDEMKGDDKERRLKYRKL